MIFLELYADHFSKKEKFVLQMYLTLLYPQYNFLPF